MSTTDTVAWKNRNIHAVNKQISTKHLELKAEYDTMIEQFEYNNLVYSTKFNFEPIIGYTYHLYHNKHGEAFLSVIAPNECNFDYVGTFKLNGTILVIGEIQHLSISEAAIGEDEDIDLENIQEVGISGLNTYYNVKKIARCPYARAYEIPDFKS